LNARHANPLLGAALRPLPRHVAIVGAGSIGPDIGYYLKSALPDLVLTLVDVAQPALDAARKRFGDYAQKAVARGKMTTEAAASVMRNVHASTDYDAIADCDWVIEAATENLALKRRIFAALEERVAADAIITSNTSSLPAARTFADMRHPERATVTHFFAPAWRNPAVEVIEWAGAGPGLVDHLRRVFCVTGKLPLTTADVSCFMLDRIFDNWCNDAALLLDRATAAEIDSVAAELVHAGADLPFGRQLGHGRARQARRSRAGHRGGDPRSPAGRAAVAGGRHPRSRHRRRGGPQSRLPRGVGLPARAARSHARSRPRRSHAHPRAPRP
jgi:enoyl-CoA hydratase/3-hydroxyacyl-CoA dehydrogenase